jgi:hypothetical protein
MKKDDDKIINTALKHLASNARHWLEIKELLLEEARLNKELIALVDKLVQENEIKISRLN